MYIAWKGGIQGEIELIAEAELSREGRLTVEEIAG